MTFLRTIPAVVLMACLVPFLSAQTVISGPAELSGPAKLTQSGASSTPTLSGTPVYCEAGSASCNMASTVATSSDFVWCFGAGIGGSTFTCTCTGGSYTALDTSGDGAGDTAGHGYLSGCTTGSNTIVAHSTGAAATTGGEFVITGGPAIDGTNHNQSAYSTSTSQATGTVTPSQSDYIVVGVVDAGGSGAGALPTISSGWTRRGAGSLIFPIDGADQTTSSSVSATWTMGSAPSHGTTFIAAFK